MPMTWTVSRSTTVGFVLAGSVLVLSAGLSYWNMGRVAESKSRVVHTHRVLDSLQQILKAFADAESGQRGYIITGQRPYLEPYDDALGTIRDQQVRLAELLADNPAQQQRLITLKEQTAARLTVLENGITARDGAGVGGGLQHILAGKGRLAMDAVRASALEMERVETDLLAAREAQSLASYRAAVTTLFATAFLGLGLVAVAYGLAAREVANRRQVAEALRQVNDELEARVQIRTADLAESNESLRRSNRELEQFASIASHDLQEPLRKIQAFGDRLRSSFAEGLGEQGRDYIARMQASATRMRTLIDALLTLSRVTTNAQPFVDVDMTTTLRDVVSDLEGRIQETGGSVQAGPLPTVSADPSQMRQLLQNLVANGLKFHRPGEPPLVRVEGRLLNDTDGDGRSGPRLEIAVSDDGIGFEEVYLDRIFELFQRLHGREQYEGTGMGLAICRKIVERHGGTITATSSPDRGSTFLVRLPIQQSREEPRNDEVRQTDHDSHG